MKSDFTPPEIGTPQRRVLTSDLLRLSHLCGVKKFGRYAVDQITSAKYQSASSSGVTPQRTVAYDWDAVGNRETVQTTPAGGGMTTDVYATANAVNQYPAINGSTVTHDANGNLTAARLQNASTGPVSTLGYDSSNRLLSVQNGSATVTSTYDTRNRVTSRTINGVTTLFLWDDWDLIEERDLSGTQTRRYVHGANVDEILIMVDATGAKYHHHDALGSVTALTNSSGAILETYNYDVFGAATVYDSFFTLQPSSLIGNRFLYTGREWISEAGIYDYRNRVFSPSIGRFLQTDPILFDAGDVNVYRYVGNNSVIATDPSGKMVPVLIAGAVAAGLIIYGLVKLMDHAEKAGEGFNDAIDDTLNGNPPSTSTGEGAESYNEMVDDVAGLAEKGSFGGPPTLGPKGDAAKQVETIYNRLKTAVGLGNKACDYLDKKEDQPKPEIPQPSNYPLP